ncbi:MAG: T9SS type A sorting domain-containing protein [Chitinophagales bacterium]|nr:T9SS type A sorting domain-containing protein [Chitinophagales bacterium]
MKPSTRLCNYILIIALCSIFLQLELLSQFAKAQIIYTDVNPDQSYYAGSYNLDLNNDGIADFLIAQDGILCPKISLVSLNLNPLNSEKTKLNLNQVIDSNLTWTSITHLNLEKEIHNRATGLCGPPNGAWGTSSDGYLALKFKIGSQYFYGWARLNIVISIGKFTIYDYAYNSIPNQFILAGDTGSIATNIHYIKNFTSLIVSPNGFKHITRISFSLPQTEKTSIIIYDVTGRIIKILANETMSAGIHQIQWNAIDENGNEASDGIYFLKMQTVNESETIRLSVMK